MSLMQLGPGVLSALRRALFEAMAQGSRARSLPEKVPGAAEPRRNISLPAQIGDYTDFYISIYHATAIGRLFRPDNPLLPNYKWIPIGYHGRSSSIGVSGQSFPRPQGQRLRRPARSPTRRAQHALGLRTRNGHFHRRRQLAGRADTDGATRRITSSACACSTIGRRGILQGWEYQPLGPFLAKNFATTISPWIVTLQALAPFRVPFNRPAGGPSAACRIWTRARNREAGAIDIQAGGAHSEPRRCESAASRRSGSPRPVSAMPIGASAQLVAHHTVNGCNLRPGRFVRQRHPIRSDAGGGRLPGGTQQGRHTSRCPSARMNIAPFWKTATP